MRTPRPHDYDPKSKRVIQPEAVDVADLSPIKPKAEPAPVDGPEPTVRPVRSERGVRAERPERPDRDPEGSISPKLPSPKKREIKRHAFEIYRDQLESLKRLKHEVMLMGQLVSMSEMVRSALDQFIQNEKPNDPYG
jgi:hypothetical protein